MVLCCNCIEYSGPIKNDKNIAFLFLFSLVFSDEDFEESSIPLPRKRNKEPVKKKETKNKRAPKNEKVEISKSKFKEKKPRTSR